MSGNWAFYPCRVENMSASIYLDLNYKDTGPMPGLTENLRLKLQMKEPRPDGLSSHEEFDQLRAIEDAIMALTHENRNLVFVGRNTSAGFREFYFYASDAETAEREISTSLEAFAHYEFELGSASDPEWRCYFGFLFPSDRDFQLIHNSQLLEQLESHGDKHHLSRPIDHTLVFPTSTAREQAALRAQAKGFIATEKEEADGAFMVTLQRSDPVTYHEINDVVLGLFDLSRELGGTYDGWGSPVTDGE